MPLPLNDSGAWPPAEGDARRARVREARAWYGGDPGKLASLYGGGTTASSHIGTTINPNGRGTVQQRAVGASSARFWSTTVAQGEPDTRRHLPIANDIAILSSEWLFGDPPKFTVLGPRWEADAPDVMGPDGVTVAEPAHRKGDPKPETVKAQERLDQILKASKAEALFLASAEIGAALGSMPLRIAFDKAKMDMPRLVRVDPDATEPTFVWGALEGVTFWRTVKVPWASSTTVLRHLELHEAGRIYHALYQGGADQLGKRIPMTEGDATCQAIAPQLDEDSALRVRFEYEGKPVKTATSIPNVLPDPLDLDNLVGRSDYTQGVIEIMDAADRVFSQFMENVEDARGRVLISRSMLETGGIGKGLTFDSSQRFFTKLNTPPAEKEGGALPLEKVQFEIRAEEYLRTIDALTAKAIEAAGWRPDGDSKGDGRDVTATEDTNDRRRSLSTRDKKIRYIESELEDLAFALLVIDAQEFSSGITPFPVEVKFPESVQPTVMELAQTAKALRDAKAASDETIIALVHPDWTEGQVSAELTRLKEQGRSIDPATIGLSSRLPGEPAAAPTGGVADAAVAQA